MFIQISTKYHPPKSPFEGAGMKNMLIFVFLNIQSQFSKKAHRS